MARDAGQGSCRRQCMPTRRRIVTKMARKKQGRRRERACSSDRVWPITAHGAKIRADVIDVYVFRRG